jgi:hypothetical protein
LQLQGPDRPGGSKGEEMNDIERTQHFREVMRRDIGAHLRMEHGIPDADVPKAKAAQDKIHRSLPHEDEPQDAAAKKDAEVISGVRKDPEPKPEPAQPAKRTRTRKPAAKAEETSEPAPAAKPEPAKNTRSRKPAAKVGTPQPASKPAAKAQPKADEKPTLGVPYAELKRRGRGYYAVCPECGEHFSEKFDRNGEQLTNAYGEHYVSTHEKKKTRSRKPAASKPAPKSQPKSNGSKPAPKAESNGASPRTTKQELAKRLVTLVAKEFSGASEADKAQLAYWLHSLPTGQQGEESGSYNRWWPASLPRPVTADWRKP